MSDLNSEPKQEVDRTTPTSPKGSEEGAEPTPANKGGGADKSKALGKPDLGDRGRVNRDQEKYD